MNNITQCIESWFVLNDERLVFEHADEEKLFWLFKRLKDLGVSNSDIHSTFKTSLLEILSKERAKEEVNSIERIAFLLEGMSIYHENSNSNLC